MKHIEELYEIEKDKQLVELARKKARFFILNGIRKPGDEFMVFTSSDDEFLVNTRKKPYTVRRRVRNVKD